MSCWVPRARPQLSCPAARPLLDLHVRPSHSRCGWCVGGARLEKQPRRHRWKQECRERHRRKPEGMIMSSNVVRAGGLAGIAAAVLFIVSTIIEQVAPAKGIVETGS